MARKDRQLAQRDADLAEAHAQLHQLQPQLEQYKHWVAGGGRRARACGIARPCGRSCCPARSCWEKPCPCQAPAGLLQPGACAHVHARGSACKPAHSRSPCRCPAELLDGAAKLAGSRARLAAAEEEAKEREGRLAALQRGILQEAEAAGLDLPGLAGRYDDAADEDAAWEQLAATIQESERAGAGGGAGEPAGGAEPQRQGASPDGGLQAAMQEAAMEGERRAMGEAPHLCGDLHAARVDSLFPGATTA